MSYTLTWLPDVLHAAGLKVEPVPGWETRGHGDVGPTRGVLLHHTAGPKRGDMPSLGVLVHGREAAPGAPALAGPLCQLGLGRDGTFHLVAAGLAWHAGPGEWRGLRTGNTSLIGIEAENTGRQDDPWPAVQLDAYRRGAAALLRHVGAGADWCIGHKEWAPKRKVDPSFDMRAFRAEVARLLHGE